MKLYKTQQENYSGSFSEVVSVADTWQESKGTYRVKNVKGMGDRKNVGVSLRHETSKMVKKNLRHHSLASTKTVLVPAKVVSNFRPDPDGTVNSMPVGILVPRVYVHQFLA